MAGRQTTVTTPTNNQSTMKQKAPMASRLQSPPPSCLLGSNDDQLERAQARAARAAAIRRKSIINPPRPSSLEDINSDMLGQDQIIELFQNCIKLASENKINQKNTWDLSLIDHLSDIIKVEDEDAETNFQKASCTLEAGVKIYSLRVDSVHSEAYKVLGGINRAGSEDKEAPVDGDHVGKAEEDGGCKKELEKKLSPLLTLESSFEALNIKKFDVAFTVDPLYHQTSAQFDEGGAKGLLLNNLGVYGGCRVLFDSLEVPGKSISSTALHENSQVIDISFARDCVDQMMINLPAKNDISPTLREIVKQFDEDYQRLSEMFFTHNQAVGHDDDAHGDNQAEVGADGFDDPEPWSFDQDNQDSTIDDCSTCSNPNAPSHHDDKVENHSVFYEAGDDDRQENMANSLFIGLGFPSKSNAWAGPDHWKYRKAKGPEQVPVSASGSLLTTKRSKSRKQEAFSVDFTNCLEMDSPDIFSPPKNPKSLLLPVNSSPSNTTLPEDCHYKPEDLVRLFCLPHIMCIGKKGKISSGDSGNQTNNYELLSSWDNGSEFSCQFDDGNVFHSDTEDSSNLVSQPRQVNKVEVQYDKSSKQVDVHALKGILWDSIQETLQMSVRGCEETAIKFSHLLANFPEDCPAAAAANDISPHLCFICLLHLANEHCLSIRSCEDLDELYIHVPQRTTETRVK